MKIIFDHYQEECTKNPDVVNNLKNMIQGNFSFNDDLEQCYLLQRLFYLAKKHELTLEQFSYLVGAVAEKLKASDDDLEAKKQRLIAINLLDGYCPLEYEPFITLFGNEFGEEKAFIDIKEEDPITEELFKNAHLWLDKNGQIFSSQIRPTKSLIGAKDDDVAIEPWTKELLGSFFDLCEFLRKLNKYKAYLLSVCQEKQSQVPGKSDIIRRLLGIDVDNTPSALEMKAWSLNAMSLIYHYIKTTPTTQLETELPLILKRQERAPKSLEWLDIYQSILLSHPNLLKSLIEGLSQELLVQLALSLLNHEPNVSQEIIKNLNPERSWDDALLGWLGKLSPDDAVLAIEGMISQNIPVNADWIYLNSQRLRGVPVIKSRVSKEVLALVVTDAALFPKPVLDDNAVHEVAEYLRPLREDFNSDVDVLISQISRILSSQRARFLVAERAFDINRLNQITPDTLIDDKLRIINELSIIKYNLSWTAKWFKGFAQKVAGLKETAGALFNELPGNMDLRKFDNRDFLNAMFNRHEFWQMASSSFLTAIKNRVGLDVFVDAVYHFCPDEQSYQYHLPCLAEIKACYPQNQECRGDVLTNINRMRHRLGLKQIKPSDYCYPGVQPFQVEQLAAEQLYQLQTDDIHAGEHLLRETPMAQNLPYQPIMLPFWQNQIDSHFNSDGFKAFSARLNALVNDKTWAGEKPIVLHGMIHVNNNHYVPFFISKDKTNQVQVIVVDPSPRKNTKDQGDEILRNGFKRIFPKGQFLNVGIAQQLDERDCGLNALQTLEDARTKSLFSFDNNGIMRLNPNMLTMNANHDRAEYFKANSNVADFIYPLSFKVQTTALRKRWFARMRNAKGYTALISQVEPEDTKLHSLNPEACMCFSNDEYDLDALIEQQKGQDVNLQNQSVLLSVILNHQHQLTDIETIKKQFRETLLMPDEAKLRELLKTIRAICQLKGYLADVIHHDDALRLLQAVIGTMLVSEVRMAITNQFSDYMKYYQAHIPIEASHLVDAFLKQVKIQSLLPCLNESELNDLKLALIRQSEPKLLELIIPFQYRKLVDILNNYCSKWVLEADLSFNLQEYVFTQLRRMEGVEQVLIYFNNHASDLETFKCKTVAQLIDGEIKNILNQPVEALFNQFKSNLQTLDVEQVQALFIKPEGGGVTLNHEKLMALLPENHQDFLVHKDGTWGRLGQWLMDNKHRDIFNAITQRLYSFYESKAQNLAKSLSVERLAACIEKPENFFTQLNEPLFISYKGLFDDYLKQTLIHELKNRIPAIASEIVSKGGDKRSGMDILSGLSSDDRIRYATFFTNGKLNQSGLELASVIDDLIRNRLQQRIDYHAFYGNAIANLQGLRDEFPALATVLLLNLYKENETYQDNIEGFKAFYLNIWNQLVEACQNPVLSLYLKGHKDWRLALLGDEVPSVEQINIPTVNNEDLLLMKKADKPFTIPVIHQLNFNTLLQLYRELDGLTSPRALALKKVLYHGAKALASSESFDVNMITDCINQYFSDVKSLYFSDDKEDEVALMLLKSKELQPRCDNINELREPCQQLMTACYPEFIEKIRGISDNQRALDALDINVFRALLPEKRQELWLARKNEINQAVKHGVLNLNTMTYEGLYQQLALWKQKHSRLTTMARPGRWFKSEHMPTFISQLDLLMKKIDDEMDSDSLLIRPDATLRYEHKNMLKLMCRLHQSRDHYVLWGQSRSTEIVTGFLLKLPRTELKGRALAEALESLSRLYPKALRDGLKTQWRGDLLLVDAPSGGYGL